MRTKPLASLLLLMVTAGITYSATAQTEPPAQKRRTPRAVERTRRQVRMLDDLYKTAVVLITDKYVNDESDFPAGGAAIALFDAMKQKGWHEVRLLDATGDPLNEDNAPRDEFERSAIARLQAGEAYYEQIVRRDGKRFLRAATPVPVVLQKCTMCHEAYKQVTGGDPIGALSYTLPIE